MKIKITTFGENKAKIKNFEVNELEDKLEAYIVSQLILKEVKKIIIQKR